MKPTILQGVDELTLVLSADIKTIKDIGEWESKAEKIISEFSRLANLEFIFGTQKISEEKCPQGYSVAYQFGDNPFYFAVAYHPLHPKIGVIVKYSAYSWSVYCSTSPDPMNIKKFLSLIKSDLYTFRLSRVDFTVDYQNWDMSVDTIYQNLIADRWEIRDFKSKKNHSTITAYEVDGVVNTFYVGSKKTGTRLFLRVYDKRVEQLEKKGVRCLEASQTLSWVRFEAVFKGTYSHQLTDIIKSTEEDKLGDLIADKILEKFRFYDLEHKEYANFSVALFEQSNNSFSRLYLASPRNNDLISSLQYLINDSGLFSTLYKCDEVFGKGTSMILLEHLHRIYSDEYKPNDDVKLWIKKHKDILEKQGFENEMKALSILRFNINNAESE